jgi:hypothetical protein
MKFSSILIIYLNTLFIKTLKKRVIKEMTIVNKGIRTISKYLCFKIITPETPSENNSEGVEKEETDN